MCFREIYLRILDLKLDGCAFFFKYVKFLHYVYVNTSISNVLKIKKPGYN